MKGVFIGYDDRVRELLNFRMYLDISNEIKFARKIQDQTDEGFFDKLVDDEFQMMVLLQLSYRRVQQELLQMQQGDMDLTEYFTKLKFTYEKMNSLKPPCKHCLKSHMEQMIVVKFLAGLSSDYSASKAQMLTGSDFPDLDEAFNRLNSLVVTLLPSSNNMQPSALASFGGGRGGLYSSRGRGRG
ncbi:Phosphoribulokinase [Nymphaea thermarum]|nr:Phosphoribulokinase [Nymphaea thermarum]